MTGIKRLIRELSELSLEASARSLALSVGLVVLGADPGPSLAAGMLWGMALTYKSPPRGES